MTEVFRRFFAGTFGEHAILVVSKEWKGRHFQKDIILVAVGYYFRFSLSYRDIVEILRDRGITVHHTTVMHWVHHYGPLFKLLWRKQRYSHSQSWRVDEIYIRIKGRWCYFYRAIDSHGLTLDFELRKHSDYQSAYHFLKRLLTTSGSLSWFSNHPNSYQNFSGCWSCPCNSKRNPKKC